MLERVAMRASVSIRRASVAHPSASVSKMLERVAMRDIVC
jgi:hypothetical protein